MNILGLLNPLGALKDGLVAAQKQWLDANNDASRLKAEENMAYFKGQIELAVAASRYDKWYSVRSLIGYCVVTLVAKLLIWDTVL